MPERGEHPTSGAASLWRFRAYGHPHLPALTAGIGCRLAELVADLLQPWPLAVVADNVIGRRRLHGPLARILGSFTGSQQGLLAAAAALSIVLIALSALFDYLGDVTMNGAGERMTAAIRADLFAHVQRLPLAWHDHQAVGELASRVIADTDRIEDGLVDVFSTLVPGVITIAGFAIVLFLLEWRLALVGLLVSPLVFLIANRVSSANRKAASERRAAEGELAAVVTETLHGISTVHAHGAFGEHDHRFATGSNDVLTAGLRAVDLRARLTPLLELAAGASATGLLWLGGYGVLRGWWTLGLLLVVLAYVRNMIKPLRALSRMSMTLARAAASADRVHAVLDTPLPARVAPAPTSPAAEGPRGLVLDAVSLDYGRGPVLDNVSLTIAHGERIALVGENGAGKSTLLALIAGLYRPTRGRVLLDGTAVADIAATDLAHHIAVVPQDTFLFTGTIRGNIRYGRPHAPDHEVEAAAHAALVDRFVQHLPHGYDTLIGNRGVGLSGGQRQRIGIARALLANCPVVLLDEPTSGLDIDAEAEVIEALRGLMTGRTVVMTTHRAPLLELADRIYEVRDRTLVVATARLMRTTPPSDSPTPRPGAGTLLADRSGPRDTSHHAAQAHAGQD